MRASHSALIAASFAVFLAPVPPAHADPFTAGDVLRATFGLQGVEVPLAPPDAFGVSVLVDIDVPFSHTVRLFDGTTLLGTYTSDVHLPPATGFPFFVSSYFVAPTSLLTVRQPTVIDFSSLLDGTIDGAIEFAIAGGPITLLGMDTQRGPLELFLGRAVHQSEALGVAVWTREFPEPIPEPASVILIGSGLAALASRRRRSSPGRR